MPVRSASPWVAGAAALVLALAGCGGGKSVSGTTQAGTTSTTTTAATTATAPNAVTNISAATTSTASSSSVTLTVQIKGGKPVGGIRRSTARKGQQVALVVHSDMADEVHVHGYDLSKDVKAGGIVRIQFEAKLTGVFEIELESRKLQIAELTVR
jgi:hypothetical protein